jgi:eukaryotic-like serine/threonine-protein kinase
MTGELFADRYLVERQIGRGGMGVVFAAKHPILDQSVAIKLLQADISEDDSYRRRFVNEARASALIENEHVVRVLDVATLANGQPYIVMEHLDGDDLAQLLRRRKRIPYREAVGYVMQALMAISAAHLQSIIHRDLKPSNLFLADRRDRSRIIKVLDFGISKLMLPADDGVTTTNALLGSPGYISPEQARSTKMVDPRTDIWSLGIILFELITGARPFVGANVGQVIVNVLENDVPAMPSDADVPTELEAVVRKCLEKDASKRFANVRDLARALVPFGDASAASSLERIEAMVGGDGAKTTTAPDDDERIVAPAGRTRPRRGLVLGVAMGALLTATSTLAAFALMNKRDASQPPAETSSIVVSPAIVPSPIVASEQPTPTVMIAPMPASSAQRVVIIKPRSTTNPITRSRTE